MREELRCELACGVGDCARGYFAVPFANSGNGRIFDWPTGFVGNCAA